jgi:hypothetical protein
MSDGPPKIAEALVSLLIPPACREEIVGDLHERFRSPGQYAADALQTIPPVIFSRIRRTADRQVLLIQGFVLYTSFLGAAWLREGATAEEHRGLLRLAIPAVTVMPGLILDDAYAKAGQRSALNLTRGPLLGFVLALAAQGALRISKPDLAIPYWNLLYGCTLGLLLLPAVKILFPPTQGQLMEMHELAVPLRQAGSAEQGTARAIQALKAVSLFAVLFVVAAWAAEGIITPQGVTLLLLFALGAYLISKRN